MAGSLLDEVFVIGFLKSVFLNKRHQTKSAVTARHAHSDLQIIANNKSTQLRSGHLLLAGLPIDLDLLFNTWVVGANTAVDISISNVEIQILAAAEDLMKADSVSELLPRVPAVIPRLLRSMRDENISAMNIAEEIAQDPTIVGEVIRVANSSYYRTLVPTSNLEQALCKLGLVGLRQVIATIAFRSIIDVRSGHYLGAGSPLLWKQTEKSAHAAGFLAARESVDVFDAYLVALVQNIGKIFELKVIDSYLKIDSPPRSIEFYQSFDKLACRLTLHIVRSWDFPSSVESALKEQINIAKSDTVSPLGSVLYTANRLGMLSLLEKDSRIQVNHEQLFGKEKSNNDNSCALCYKELADLDSDSRLS